MKEKSVRQSNIELLRIFSMLLIISFHYVYKSGYTYEYFSMNTFIVKIIYFFGELGVNLFFLISGYFLVKSKFSLKKLILLILEVDFYNLICMLIAVKLGVYQPVNTKDYLLFVFPVILIQYWFVTAYILVYILSPYFNKLINSLNKQEYNNLLFILLIIWSVIPSIFGIFYNNTETLLFYSRFIWFIVMYFIGAYIRIYGIPIVKKHSIKIAILTFFIMVMSILFFYKFRNIFSMLGLLEISYFWPPNTILMVILSVSVFHIFLNINIKSNKIINKLASTTLAIYMIHDGALSGYLWNNIFKSGVHLQSKYLIFHIVAATIIIFLVGAIIDLVRQLLEKYSVKIILDKIIKDEDKTNKVLVSEVK